MGADGANDADSSAEKDMLATEPCGLHRRITRDPSRLIYQSLSQVCPNYRVAQKSKPLPSDQTIVLNRIKACQ